MDRRWFLSGLAGTVAGTFSGSGLVHADAAGNEPPSSARALPAEPHTAAELSAAEVVPAPAEGFEAITLYVPSLQAGGWSVTARALEECLFDAGLARQITTRFGAGGPVSGLDQFLAEHERDGSSLMIAGVGLIGASLLGGGDVAALAPIARLTTENMVVAVAGSSDVGTLKELMIALGSEPRAIRVSGGPIGSGDHLLAVSLARAAGIGPERLVYSVRPPQSPGGLEVMGGRAACTVGGLSELQADISLGRLRPLAISAAQRVPGVNIPTFVEQGVDLVQDSWRGLFAGPGTRVDERMRLEALVARLVTTPAWKARLFQYNWRDVYLPQPAFGVFMTAEIARTRRILAELRLT